MKMTYQPKKRDKEVGNMVLGKEWKQNQVGQLLEIEEEKEERDWVLRPLIWWPFYKGQLNKGSISWKKNLD